MEYGLLHVLLEYKYLEIFHAMGIFLERKWTTKLPTNTPTQLSISLLKTKTSEQTGAGLLLSLLPLCQEQYHHHHKQLQEASSNHPLWAAINHHLTRLNPSRPSERLP